MKTLSTIHNYCFILLALSFGLTAQAQLLNETFDNADGFTIADQNGDATFFSDGSNDYFGIYDGDGDGGANFGTSTSNPSGTESYSSTSDNYIVGEDLDSEGNTGLFILTWTSIALSGETTLKISADFASTRIDADDSIIVSYRLGEGDWVGVLGISGAPGTYNSPPYEITDFSTGAGDSSATQVNGAFTNLDNTITLAGTETTIQLKAEFETGNGSDNLAMDNLIVEVPSADRTSPMTFTLIGDSTEYSVSDCLTTASGSLEIPSTYNGLPVTSIEFGAFRECSSLISITIPNSVTSIGSAAFQDCTSLISITIPDGVTSIGERTFSGCTSLTSITIPDSITSIGNAALAYCTSLKSVTFEGDTPTFGTDVFTGSGLVTIHYYDDATGFSTPTFQGRPSQMLIRGNQQFQIIEGNFTWNEAKADAEARGGQLAVLNTQEKIIAANEYLLSLGTWSNVFIGLTDEEVEGSWKWINGLALGTEDWAEQNPEPNGGANENYAVIRGSDSSGWADVEGDLTLSYLLETPEPLAPVLSLDTFYESNSGVSITIDATPTDGYPSSFTYQWYLKAVGDNSYFIIPSNFGGTASTFQILGDLGNNGTWKVEVTNEAGSITKEFNYRVYVDSDSDGLSDGQEEFVIGTDPNDNDSDDDSLLDGVETNTGIWVSALDTGTDPLSNDSDSDGLLDGVETNTAEYIDASDTGTDPNDSDSDNDGLLDGTETNTKVYVSTSDTGTNPLESDSDYDGYSDYVETNTGTWTSGDDTGTDPNRVDTDNDGIIDGRETNTGIYVAVADTGTNPLDADSDSDGFSDKYEVEVSNDPNNSDDSPDADGFIETAVEYNFHAASGGIYRIEHSENLDPPNWVIVEDGIVGEGGLVERLYSTDDYSRRFFRAIRTDQ